MNFIKLFAAVALGAAACGAATITVDQQNTSGSLASGIATNLGQSFTAGLSSIDAAFFNLKTNGGFSTTVVVDLFDGIGYGGTLLGTTGSVTFGSTVFQTIEFDFASSIALTAGNTYSLRIGTTSGALFAAQFSSSNPYSRGAAISNVGNVVPIVDLVFSEGPLASVAPDAPEPASIALGLTGLAGILVARRRRRAA